MSKTMIPTTPDAITPEWLTDVLGARVVSVATQMVGTGQMGDSVRLSLEYATNTDAPATVVAKLPAADPTSRATAAAVRSYEIEVSFYRELAPSLPVRAPRAHAALHDPETDDFILLLEDLAPARQGDQLEGCSIEQATIAVDELPKLHAPLWGDGSLTTKPWLHRNTPESAVMTTMLVTGLYDGFRSRYADRLDPDVFDLCERFIPRLGPYLARRPGEWTVAHGDYRLDNLLFGTDEGGPPVAVVDWQTVSHGPGVADLSYFIGAGLLLDDRRANESDLVHRYHDAMQAAGVKLDWDDCWEQYRRYTFAGLVMAVAASMLVEQTDRGDDMFMAMANRHGRHALDLDAEALID
jgi:Phosphotransferase enzyme family